MAVLEYRSPWFTTLRNDKYDMILIMETWLKPEHLSSSILSSTEHVMFRCDRKRTKGGGVAIIVKKHHASRINQVAVEEHEDFELIVVDYYHSRKSFIRFACVYNPPINSINPSKIIILVNSLIKIIPKQNFNSDLYMFGDFNFNDVDWTNLNSHFNRKSFQLFSDFLNKHSLSQLITKATHKLGNTLDLVIASNPLSILNIEIGEPFCRTCDHFTICLIINFQCSKPLSRYPSYKFHYADFEKINNFLSKQHWVEVLKPTRDDINSVYSRFTTVIHESFSKFVPFSKSSKRPRFPKQIRDLLNKKKNIYRRLKTDSSLKMEYNTVDKLYKKSVKAYFKSYEEKVTSSLNKNMFYSYVKKKLNSPSYLPPLLNPDGSTTLDPGDKANTLNSFFSSVFLSDSSSVSPKLSTWNTNFETMPFFVITSKDVTEAISSLNSTVSRTPDGIPCVFLKKTASMLSKPLTLIFNLSLETGSVPSLWKQALIAPIFKKGRRNNPENYRPVSLTSALCRILEKILHKKIMSHLINSNLISKAQHGFLVGRSTLTQQLSFFDHLTKFQSNKLNCDVIYLDFTKAFDKISHNKLIQVLSHFKINFKLLNWVKNFLTNRTQQTVVEGVFSNSSPVTSGVPQGSVLGPLFFVLYLESLVKILLNYCKDTEIFAYADDLKLLSSNHLELQNALNLVETWSNEWGLRLQPKKSEHLSFNFYHNPVSSSIFFLGNNGIPLTNTVKDLGITLSNNFKWEPYISKITSKANILSYNIIRSFTSNNILLYSNLFKTYIRPILEYNTVIWNPHLIVDIKKVELIQRRFTRLICQKTNTKFTCYQDRLRLMNLESLESRRVRFDLIFMYKILNNIVDVSFDEHFKKNLAIQNYNLRGHKSKLERFKHSGSSIRNRFFCKRVVPVWNALPTSIVESPNIINFKKQLDNFDLTTIYASKI